jgi:hypothetical protein
MTELKVIESRHTKQIKKFIDNTSRCDSKFSQFIKNISLKGQLYIVGGCLRDIINEREIDDLDIIIKLPKEKLLHFILKLSCPYRINNLGGFKLIFDSIIVDIWTFEENWAFKEKVLEKRKQNIQKGTFFNFDSLVYNFSRNRFYSQEYNKCIRSGILDILVESDDYKNKAYSPETLIIKAFALHYTYNLEFSDSVKQYIKNFIDNDVNALKKIFSCTTKQYRKNIMENITIDEFVNL